MKKIIYRVKPFLMEQTLMVYEDGNKIDVMKAPMEDLHSSLFQLMDKHQVFRLDLVGPKKYSTGLANQIQKAKEVETKFNLKELEINII